MCSASLVTVVFSVEANLLAHFFHFPVNIHMYLKKSTSTSSTFLCLFQPRSYTLSLPSYYSKLSPSNPDHSLLLSNLACCCTWCVHLASPTLLLDQAVSLHPLTLSANPPRASLPKRLSSEESTGKATRATVKKTKYRKYII